MAEPHPAVSAAVSRPARVPSAPPLVGSAGLRSWIGLCTTAESVGMAAAAAAATAADELLADPSVLHRWVAWLAVLIGAITEAAALGMAQSVLLRTRIPVLRTTRFLLTTVVVAGGFWAVASVPALIGSVSETGEPSRLLIVPAGAALGAVAGALLGGAQTMTFRSQVTRPWVWTVANMIGWALAMPVIMLAASVPAAGWPTVTVLSWAGLTGLVAGAVLGAVLGGFAPSLQGMCLHNRVVLTVLRRGRPRRVSEALIGLRLTGRRTGREIRLPVKYAEGDAALWVAVGRTEHKTWWRNLIARADVEVLQNGSWHRAVAELVPPTDPRYPDGRAAYGRRWPRARLGRADPMVRIAEEEHR